ncbi:MAG: hypothetical protein C0502_03965 [Opitutus sp.]|nr:hypothetical protein [Opitutus sp.]
MKTRSKLLLPSLALGLLPALEAAPAVADPAAALKAALGSQPGGIAVAWVEPDGVVFHQAGQFAPDDSRPVTADTLFEIGSVTKVYTSLLLAEGELQGKVRRDDPAAKHLFPADDPVQEALRGITLLSLSTHSSGLPRLPGNHIEANSPHPYAEYGDDRLHAALRLHGPAAPAGRATAYSNFGAALLGAAVARAWGENYGAALRQRVLAPLGLEHTLLNLTGTTLPADAAPGFARAQAAPRWTFRAMAPAGALVSTARDQALFLQACLGLRETPLRAAIDESIKPLRDMEAIGTKIGLAWLIMQADGRRVIFHNGGTAGFRAFVAFSPERKTGVVVLASNSAVNTDKLGFELLGAKPPAPAAGTLARTDAEPFLGSYTHDHAPAVSMVVTFRRGSLFVQLTAQPALRLEAQGKDHFRVVDVLAEISFERADDGTVAALILHQSGIAQRFGRTKEIALPPGELGELAGEYALGPVTVTMSAEGGRLFTQLTGQPRFEAFARDRDVFFLKVVNAELHFQRDAAGKVTALVLRQNGRDQTAARK